MDELPARAKLATPVLPARSPAPLSNADATRPSFDRQTRHWGDAAALATSTMWGVNILLTKWAIGSMSPLAFNGIRLVLAALALGGFVWLQARWQRRDGQTAAVVPWRQISWRPVLLFALLTGLVYQWLFITSIERTTAGNAALLLSSMPMWTAVLSFCLAGERLSSLSWLGLAITFFGTGVVIAAGGSIDLRSEYLVGNLLMIAAAIAWAWGTVVSRGILYSLGPIRLSFLAGVLTAPLHLLIAGPQLGVGLQAMANLPILLTVVYSGVISTGLAYVTWNYGVRHLGGSQAAVYQNLVTLIAVLGGWFWLGESIRSAQILGGIAIVVGLLVMRRGRK